MTALTKIRIQRTDDNAMGAILVYPMALPLPDNSVSIVNRWGDVVYGQLPTTMIGEEHGKGNSFLQEPTHP